MVKLPWPPWVVLRLQGIADCYGHQFSLRPLLVYEVDSLFPPQLDLTINTKGYVQGAVRVCRPNCNFLEFPSQIRVDWLILCCLSRDWPLEVDRLVLVSFLKRFHKPRQIFFLGHAFSLSKLTGSLIHFLIPSGVQPASWQLFHPRNYNSNGL